jgi:hypothetical protein
MAHHPIPAWARHSSAQSAPKSAPPHEHRIRHKVRNVWLEAPLWLHILIVAIGAMVAVSVVLITANWPYRHRKIKPVLEDMLASQVTFTRYHRIYFPNPGFVATGVTMRRKSALNLPPLGHIDTLVVEGRWSDLVLLRRRIQLVDITGLQIVVPAIGSKENHQEFPPGSGRDFAGPDTMIERLMVHKSLLDIMRTNGQRYSFPIKQLEIRNLHHGEPMTWAVDMQNAFPHGHILARGSMGPIKGASFVSTPLDGNFAFMGVNLHEVGEISGILHSRGVFKGYLQSMNIEVSSATKDFAVTDGKPTPIDGTMQATLSGSNGDLNIHAIQLNVRGTEIHANGTINGAPKTTNLDITVEHGRAEDVMRPFIHDEVPIAGPVSLKCHAYLGPPGNGFIERLRVTGAFVVPAEKVTDPDTEKTLSAFSERASGKQKPNTGVESNARSQSPQKDVLSSLDGPVQITNGIASTPHVIFRVPGAEATLAGTYRFHDESVHLNGKLRMDTDISHTTTGFKSYLLKPLAPFFRKKNAGAVIPIAVTGMPGRYKVSQDITGSK